MYQNEQEPNDNFAQATLNNNIICPATNPLKCNGTLNPTSDQQDYWDIQVNQGSINVNKGVVVGTNNPDKFKIQLVCISISSGCMMYMYDADKHLTGTSNIATIGNNQEFNIIAQVNSSIFIEVIPNSGASPGDYQLVIDNFTESLNPAFDDKNRFSTAVEFNITQEYNSPGLEDLSYTHDLADFYKFFEKISQKPIIVGHFVV